MDAEEKLKNELFNKYFQVSGSTNSSSAYHNYSREDEKYKFTGTPEEKNFLYSLITD